MVPAHFWTDPNLSKQLVPEIAKQVGRWHEVERLAMYDSNQRATGDTDL